MQMIVSSDLPVTSRNGDFVKRDEFVSTLANVITAAPKGDSFTIGLFGEWGSGKASVINFLTEKLNENNQEIKVIRFDPWIYSDDTQLLDQFFRVIAGELKENSSQKTLANLSDAFELHVNVTEMLELIPVAGE